jgi:5-hydroxyisourate hydrolase-like protein (transthyretin family)
MRYPTFFAAMLFCVSTCMAQPSTEFRAEGTVVDAETGQPISGAHVEIGRQHGCDAASGGSATTADDGTFKIPLKTSGPFTACVQRDGYVTASQALTQFSPCTATIRIHAAANINGRVLSADANEPINGVLVEAIRVTDSFDIATSRTAASVRSSPNGEFSLGQLMPGQYYFRFTPANPAAPLLIDDGHDPTAKPFAVQWWPGGNSSHGATPFTILAGTSFQLPDIWIPAVPRFQVSGTLEATICQAGDAYNVSIGEHRGTSVAMIRSMMVRCGAEFSFGDLAPGRYEIRLLLKDGGAPVAQEEAVVTDRNLERNFAAAHATP